VICKPFIGFRDGKHFALGVGEGHGFRDGARLFGATAPEISVE
jgi:hypothetical protein